MWLTTSLRGTAIGTLTIKVLTEGVHSGDASGIVPSSFRIARMLLSRLEDESSGRIIPRGFYVDIPSARVEQAKAAAAILGRDVYAKFPFAGSTRPIAEDTAELILNRTWRPQLAVIGADGLPVPSNAGAVLLPSTTLKISLRLPPMLDSDRAMALLKKTLLDDPPYGAQVTFDPLLPNNTGWNAPALAPWLEASVSKAGEAAWGKPMAFMGEGGTIPFMAMLGEKFPSTQFVITGVLGPASNAHGPNEFLHIPTGKRVSQTVAMVLADYAARTG
jgi:acetylornithine deacetylase/succinyl-diaminopimelate desuccinylase-like protein